MPRATKCWEGPGSLESRFNTSHKGTHGSQAQPPKLPCLLFFPTFKEKKKRRATVR